MTVGFPQIFRTWPLATEALPEAAASVIPGPMADAAQPLAVFLMGTIGAGKTTLGRALARELGGGHVEGDDYQQRSKPWFAASLSTCRGVLGAVLALAAQGRPATISYPLRCREWIFYRRRLAEAGMRSAFVAVLASQEALFAPGRGRAFSVEERRRISEMLDQGYGARPFADLIVRTDQGGVDDSLARIVDGLRRSGFLPSTSLPEGP